MKDIKQMCDNLDVAIVAADANNMVFYANERCKKLFKTLGLPEDFVGKNMHDCHQPATVEKMEKLIQEYREKKRILDYFVMDAPDGGKITAVNVPFYEGGTYAGIVEFAFESKLD